MPILQAATTSATAVGASIEPCQGWTYEYLPWPAAVKILATCAGGTAAGTISVYSGSEAIIENQGLSRGTTLVLPADLNTHPITFHAPAGDRLRVKLTSGDAAQLFQYVIVVEPIR